MGASTQIKSYTDSRNDFIISNFLMTSRTLEDTIFLGKNVKDTQHGYLQPAAKERVDKKGRKEITMELIFSILYQLSGLSFMILGY